MKNWHLQIVPPREWVVWWYGPRTDGGGHVDPALLSINIGDLGVLDIPFELPKHRDGSDLEPPQEVRRVTSWGWRTRSNNGVADSGWRLAESREECITAAREWDERQPLHSRTNPTADVREYFGGLW